MVSQNALTTRGVTERTNNTWCHQHALTTRGVTNSQQLTSEGDVTNSQQLTSEGDVTNSLQHLGQGGGGAVS